MTTAANFKATSCIMPRYTTLRDLTIPQSETSHQRHPKSKTLRPNGMLSSQHIFCCCPLRSFIVIKQKEFVLRRPWHVSTSLFLLLPLGAPMHLYLTRLVSPLARRLSELQLRFPLRPSQRRKRELRTPNNLEATVEQSSLMTTGLSTGLQIDSHVTLETLLILVFTRISCAKFPL